MSGLKASIGEISAHHRELAAKKFGATEEDVLISRQSGFDPQDVMTLRQFTLSRMLLIIFRCPEVGARALHGTFPAKTAATSAKSGSSGAVIGKQGAIMVSDYDLMSCWRQNGVIFEKMSITAKVPGAKFGAWEPEARDLVSSLNNRLVSRIQHGAQDDWTDVEKNRGVKSGDGFLCFAIGKTSLIYGAENCKRFYEEKNLFWPYMPNGKHSGLTKRS